MNAAGEDIWSFCLRFYNRPGVSSACLAFQQDHGGDVVLVLYLLHLARSRRFLTVDGIRECDRAAREWRSDVIHPLRRLRGILKAAPAEYPQAAALRETIASAEIEAERMQLLRLAACDVLSQQAATAVAAASISLANCCACLRLPSDSLAILLTLFADDVKE